MDYLFTDLAPVLTSKAFWLDIVAPTAAVFAAGFTTQFFISKKSQTPQPTIKTLKLSHAVNDSESKITATSPNVVSINNHQPALAKLSIINNALSQSVSLAKKWEALSKPSRRAHDTITDRTVDLLESLLALIAFSEKNSLNILDRLQDTEQAIDDILFKFIVAMAQSEQELMNIFTNEYQNINKDITRNLNRAVIELRMQRNRIEGQNPTLKSA